VTSTATYQTEISANVVLLCRFLRKKSFNITVSEEADALKAIGFLPIHSEGYFREALKSVLTKSQLQQTKFDAYYHEFKEQLKKATDSKVKELPENKEKPEKKTKEARFEALKDWLNLNPSEEEKEVSSFSDMEVLTKKNFLDLSEDEMRLMMRVLQKMARKLAHQKSRLRKRSKRHQHLDLKQTIRSNMRKGGDIQQLVFSQKKDKKLKLVLLCDVSRSMELYSRFFIHLIYAFQNAYDKIETLVFSTALHKVSEILDNNEFDKAFETISERVPHWSGGTTIGSCLQDFTENYGHGMLDKKTIVLILSDGWDTGEPEVMKEAMKTIYKKSKKVIWLNPLAGSPDFSPEVIGMKTALPYIDVLASAHNLESLKQVLQQIHKKRNLLNRHVF
jgi:uncharacterized protein with von Willebrand factor type A (vWA) domain